MNILVPTDFSHPAAVALAYAAGLATQTASSLVLLHVAPHLGPTLGRVSTHALVEDMTASIEEDLQKIAKPLQSRGISVHYSMEYGNCSEVVDAFARANKIDLIIMGSKGASGLKKVLLGSNTVDVINTTRLPVLVVPELAVYAPIKRIVYACDLKNVLSEVAFIVPFARLLHASVTLVHVLENEASATYPEGLSDYLASETGYDQIKTEVIRGSHVAEALAHHCCENRADLLVLFTHKTGFLEQLTNESVTRELAFGNQTPLLVINNR